MMDTKERLRISLLVNARAGQAQQLIERFQATQNDGWDLGHDLLHDAMIALTEATRLAAIIRDGEDQ